MLYICGAKLDVIRNLKKFIKYFRTKQDHIHPRSELRAHMHAMLWHLSTEVIIVLLALARSSIDQKL